MNTNAVTLWLEDVARRLKDIGHTDENKRFARNTDELAAAITVSIPCTEYTLVVDERRGQLMYNGNWYDRPMYGFWIVKKVTHQDWAQEDAVKDGALKIVMKVVGKMDHECETESGLMQFVDRGTISYSYVGPAIDMPAQLFGAYCQFAFVENVHDEVIYNPDDWTE